MGRVWEGKGAGGQEGRRAGGQEGRRAGGQDSAGGRMAGKERGEANQEGICNGCREKVGACSRVLLARASPRADNCLTTVGPQAIPPPPSGSSTLPSHPTTRAVKPRAVTSRPAQARPAQSRFAQSRPAQSSHDPRSHAPRKSRPAQSRPAQSRPAQSRPAQSSHDPRSHDPRSQATTRAVTTRAVKPALSRAPPTAPRLGRRGSDSVERRGARRGRAGRAVPRTPRGIHVADLL